MSVLAYIESENGNFKKAALEVASYASALANQTNSTLTAIVFNAEDCSVLGKYGVDKILNVQTTQDFNAEVYADIIKQAAEKEHTRLVVLSSSADSKYLAPMLCVGLKAGYVPNVVSQPTSIIPFQVKRSVFTNKAFEITEITTEVKIIGLSNNAFGLVEKSASASVEAFEPIFKTSKISVKGVDRATDKVSIADADIVVSAGRGLKGPENWNLIENLAEVLGAATACSKPVSDLGWRP
ncbi:MAG: FAD-binding protein, partial [Bacteroidota bacterium]|nr:FAD-binding protein [Bacteroidota bacterium]